MTITTTVRAPVTATQAIAAGRFASGAGETEQKGQFIVDYARARIFWLPAGHALYQAKAGVEAGAALAIAYTPDDAAARPGARRVPAVDRRLPLHRGRGRGPGAEHLCAALLDPTGGRSDLARRALVRAGRSDSPSRCWSREAASPRSTSTGRPPDGRRRALRAVPGSGRDGAGSRHRQRRCRSPCGSSVSAKGWRRRALARPLLTALAALVPAGSGGADAEAEEPDALAIEAVSRRPCGALAGARRPRDCGRDADWLARLSDADGRALSEAMWAANSAFFLRRVVDQVVARAKREMASPLPSTGCSTPSSAPATGAATVDLSERLTWRQIVLFYRAAAEPMAGECEGHELCPVIWNSHSAFVRTCARRCRESAR